MGTVLTGQVLVARPAAAKNCLPKLIFSRYNLDMLRFEWDEQKNRQNRAKHGIWFEEARTAFDDPHGRVFGDPEHSEDEERLILLGTSSASRVLVVVHCYRESESRVRLISARKATKKERKTYEERI